MSTKAQPDNSVVERRLRQIYDWLDVGHNKRALQECEKVLRKTPHLQCARALKALALHRMGRAGDARALLDALARECPADDPTLQAMTLAFRELRLPERVARLYEGALERDPRNEELHTHLFMAHARAYDYRAQQRCALALYKRRPKTPYYCWAVMSVVLQATRGPDAQQPRRQVLLALAERMMQRLVDDGKLEAEQEIQLYVLVLDLQRKHAQILQLLDGPLGAKLACSNSPLGRIRHAKALGDFQQVNAICRRLLEASVDRWDVWREYVESSFALGADRAEERCHEFICRAIEAGGGFALRAPFLARFELARTMDGRGRATAEVLGDRVGLFVEYFRRFGHKPCVVNDLRVFLGLLSDGEMQTLATRLIRDVGLGTGALPQTENQMQSHLSALQLARLCGAHKTLNFEHRKALIIALSLHYQHGYQQYGNNLLSTDLGLSDSYALLAVHLLYDLAYENDDSDLIVSGLMLLNQLLKNSPNNFHAKLLAVRLYHTIGGCMGAQFWYNSLDVKHLQLDSLGFVHCGRLATCGMYSTAGALFDLTLKFFSTNYKDSSDHITLSYKYGSFLKLEEFMDFRERLNNSYHYTNIVIDRIILNLIECNNLDALFNTNLSLKDNDIDWEQIRDNHDLCVYISWDPERISNQPETYPEIIEYNKQNVKFLKLKTSCIWAISTCLDVIKSNEVERLVHIEELNNIVKKWETEWLECKSNQSARLRQDLVTLPLPSRLHNFLSLPYFEILAGFAKVFIHLALGESQLEQSIETITNSVDSMLNEVETRVKIRTNLMQQRETLETITNAVEIVSMSFLFSSLCMELVKPSQKKTRRKGQQVNGEATSIEIIEKLGLKESTSRLVRAIEDWSQFLLKADGDCLPNVFEFDCLQSNNDELKVVCDNVQQSYQTACKEMQNVLKSKLKVIH